MFRIIVILGCLFGLYKSIDGIWVTASTSGKPVTLSLNEIVAHPGQKLPRYLIVTDASPSWFVCSGMTASNGECTDMKVPLLTEQQNRDNDDGKEVTAAVIVKTTSELTRKCNTDKTCLIGVSYKGITEGDMVNDLDSKDRGILSGKKINLDGNSVYLDMQEQPESYGFYVFSIVLCLVFLLLAVLWPRKRARAEV